MSDYKVDLVEDNISEMNVQFHGPKDSESPAVLTTTQWDSGN